MPRRSLPALLSFFTLGGIVLLVVYLYTLLFIPLQRKADSVVIEIPFGMTVHETAHFLKDRGLIPSASAFKLLVRLTASKGTIRAGEYRLSESMSPWEILGTLRKGEVVLHRVTVPEGLRGVEVARIVAETFSLSRERLIALLDDPKFIQSLGVHAPTLEGYLLPETYSFPKHVTEKQVLQKMVGDMFSFFDEKKRERAASLGMNMHQVLTLASIIEKEAGREDEKPLISSVYHNRLKKNMRLQSDPTVIYGIKNFDGNLRWRDLKKDTPYNTYLRAGLPPTPIANPGKGSILAALYPAESPYLYFVSRNDGTHVFSASLAEHNRAVNRYQRRRE
jgi:UPF0755 protein